MLNNFTDKMREIFKTKKGKDFYRDQLEYMEYNVEMFQNTSDDDEYHMSDEEIAYKIAKKIEHTKPY